MYQYKLQAYDLYQVIKFLTVLNNLQWIDVLSIIKITPANGAQKYYEVEFNSTFSMPPLRGLIKSIHNGDRMTESLAFRK